MARKTNLEEQIYVSQKHKNTWKAFSFIILTFLVLALAFSIVQAANNNKPLKDLKIVSESNSKKNVKNAYETYPTITLNEKRFFGLLDGDKVAEIKLIDNTDFCSTNCYAILNVTLSKAQDNVLGDIQFRKENGKGISYTTYTYNKQILILKNVSSIEEYKTSECIENVSVYIPLFTCHNDDCSETSKTYVGETCKAFQEITKSRTVYRDEYVPYTGETLAAGNYKFKITGQKSASEKIDWVPTILDSRIESLAWWNSTEKFGNGTDGELMFTTSTKTYGNLVNNVDYTVAGNTLYLMLNRVYQFTNVTIGPGTLVTSQNSTGAVLYIMANQSIVIEGILNLTNVLVYGNANSSTFTYNGDVFTTPGVSNGGTSCTGEIQGTGVGGGGTGGATVVEPYCGSGITYYAGIGGNGNASYNPIGGAGVSVSRTLGAQGCSSLNGTNGTYAGGGSGTAFAYLLVTSGTCSNWVITQSSTSGGGSSSLGGNGTAGSQSISATHGTPWGACYYNYGGWAGGGGGGGGQAGKSGINLVLKSDNVLINGTIALSGTNGGEGGSGGLTAYTTGPGGGYTGYSGYSGGGGGAGNSGNAYIYYSSSYNNVSSTFISGSTTGGLAGVYYNGATWQRCGSTGTVGTGGTLTATKAGGTYVTLNSPANGTTIVLPSILYFNTTIEPVSTTLINATFSLWKNGVLNQTEYQTLTGTTAVNISFNVSILNLSDSSYKWNVYACSNDSTLNYCTRQATNNSFDTFGVVFANVSNYNNNTYELFTERYQINATSATANNVSAVLVWDGTEYPSTNIGNNTDLIFNASIMIPVVGASNKTFYWKIVYGGEIRYSNTENVTVNELIFSICSNTTGANTSFLNVTYKDELSNLIINESIIGLTLHYYTTNVNMNKTYTYSNATEIPNQTFCVSPPHANINIKDGTYRYTGLFGLTNGYRQKTWYPLDIPLTNATTNIVLYNIPVDSSWPFTFITIDASTSQTLANTNIVTSREIGGVLTQIDSVYTDSAGSTSIAMSTIFPYSITATHAGCTPYSFTLLPNPAQSTQYIQLSCTGTTTNATFRSNIDGLTYQRGPSVGILHPGIIIFDYYLHSTFYNITRARFELYDNIDRSILAYNDTAVSSGYSFCNATDCLLTIQYTAVSGDNIKSRYYVALTSTNTTILNNSLYLLEADGYWRFIVINQNYSVNSMSRFFNHMNQFFLEWSGDSGSTANCAVYNTLPTCNADTTCKWVNYSQMDYMTNTQRWYNKCVLKDSVNKAEFNRFVVIFFFLAIILFIIGKLGYEMNNPGSFVLILTGLIWLLSIYGMFTFSGLTSWAIMNQYFYAFISSLYSIGYAFSVFRRYSG